MALRLARMAMRPAPRVRADPVGGLDGYLAISSAFETQVVFDVEEGPGGYALVARALGAPFRKDYDAIESPLDWPRLFDVSNWMLFNAYQGERKLGSAIGAMDSPGVQMLEARRDLAVLWDLRVAPDARNAGVGAMLFQAVERWARNHSCVELKVETQNVNVAACRLYRGQSCSLAQVKRDAYPGLPGEIQLIWRKPIARPA